MVDDLKKEQPPENKVPVTPATKKKKGGCLKACLIFLLVLLLLFGAAAALVFNIPKRLGWIRGPGERFTAATPERLTAEEIVAEAVIKGFKAEGVEVYVFPKPDSEEAVLSATFDFSKGASLSRLDPYNPVVGTLMLLGGGAKAKEYAVTHVGTEFRDEKGNLLMAVAASTADLRELAEGKISEEVYLNERLKKMVDFPNYVQRAIIPF